MASCASFGQVAPAVAELEAVVPCRAPRASACNRARWTCAQGATAPSRSDTLSSGTTRSGSMARCAAEAVAGRAGAERVVEREQPRLDLGDGEAGDRAGEFLGEQDALVRLVRGLVDARPRRSGWRRAACRRTRRWRCRRRASARSRSESARRVARSARTTMRSTTTSMSCLNFLSSAGASAIS